ncbi:rhomboid family intramembrane serine protease [Periweissella cryptocerci]|uniref:Rhomboid family intramembrane serine protease n=1 Tax=Periweissella cryptocerci TaxID=2506420 RepID=A0A4P6YU16_9LACO|nr:rhomboid family intramembrane serine protease [Periweissella cryptocerci]QBO36269.1 rhomboid family intramembrane serine protease [Periweissella cryptocerci]
MGILKKYKIRVSENKKIRAINCKTLPWFTILLSVSLLIIYYFQTLTQNIYNQFALDPLMVEYHGEYYRILTSVFLHGSWDHVIGNVVLILLTSWRLEKLIGHTRIMIVYLVASISGSILSMVVNPNLTYLGASIGVAGLFGITLVLRYYFIKNNVVKAFITGWQVVNSVFWLLIIGLIIYDLGLEPSGTLMINNVGHIGGLIGGTCSLLVINVSKKVGNFNKYLRVSAGAVLILGSIWCAFRIYFTM